MCNGFVQLHEKEMEFVRGVGNFDLSDEEETTEQPVKDKEDERTRSLEPVVDRPKGSAIPSRRKSFAKRKLPTKDGKVQKQQKRPRQK